MKQLYRILLFFSAREKKQQRGQRSTGCFLIHGANGQINLRFLGQRPTRIQVWETSKGLTIYNFIYSCVDEKPGVRDNSWKELVGAKGFEPSTSWSRTRRASQAALRPDGLRQREVNVLLERLNNNISGAVRATGVISFCLISIILSPLNGCVKRSLNKKRSAPDSRALSSADFSSFMC